MLWVLLLALAPNARPQATAKPQPTNPALASKIDSLFHTVFTTNDDKQDAAARTEVRQIYARHGLLSIAEVGDSDSYKFSVLLEGDTLPLDQRSSALARIKAAAARNQVPGDAAAFYAAHMRLEVVKRQAETTPPTNPALRDEIERLLESDQAVRQRQGFDRRKMMAVDAEHAAPLRAILEKYGVPTYAMVGPKAAADFVLMLQHQAPQLRRQALPGLKANVETGQADPQSYAMMYDKAQRDLGKAQWYGEAMECKPGETMHLAPLADPRHVDERRASIGLLRLGIYSRLLTELMPQFCPPAKP